MCFMCFGYVFLYVFLYSWWIVGVIDVIAVCITRDRALLSLRYYSVPSYFVSM